MSEETAPAHVHDYDEDGDCRVCGRDLFAGGEDGATPEAAATAQTPGQAFHESLNAATAGSLLPWDDLEGQFRDDIENAVKAAIEAAIEAARLRQPEELRAAMAETRTVREGVTALAAELETDAARDEAALKSTSNGTSRLLLQRRAELSRAHAALLREAAGGQA